MTKCFLCPNEFRRITSGHLTCGLTCSTRLSVITRNIRSVLNHSLVFEVESKLDWAKSSSELSRATGIRESLVREYRKQTGIAQAPAYWKTVKRPEFQNPLRSCAVCLSKMGFGIKRIGFRVARDKSLVRRWLMDAGIILQNQKFQAWRDVPALDYRRCDMSFGNGKRRAGIVGDLLVARAQFAAFKLEQRGILEMDDETRWRNHDAVRCWRDKWKRHNDPAFKAKFYLRKRVRNYLKWKGIRKNTSISKLIGCDKQTLVSHIEARFTRHMRWDNHGSYWELDHIIPLDAFDLTKPDELARAAHYTNIQPLTVLDNRLKRCKIIHPQQSLAI